MNASLTSFFSCGGGTDYYGKWRLILVPFADVYAQSSSRRHLRVPLQGGRVGRAEGFLRPEAPGAGADSEPARHQDDAVAQVEELCQGAVCVASLLLVPDERGHRVSALVPAPAPGDCSVDAEAGGPFGAPARPWCRRSRRTPRRSR
uniref:(northern house mosquito) hypothetical protein n=1 Tax=Culex pipiens TaxID=7175 RepID=A0A8D8FFY8_CULPI